MTITNVALLGSKFMGRAHSNAWMSVGKYFPDAGAANLHTVAARNAADLERFADSWGWSAWTTDWREGRDPSEVDLVDVATPNDVHAEQAIAALEAGKHVACEKPLAADLDGARAMAAARPTPKERRSSGTCTAGCRPRTCSSAGEGGRAGSADLSRAASCLQSWRARHSAAVAIPGRRRRLGCPRRPQCPHLDRAGQQARRSSRSTERLSTRSSRNEPSSKVQRRRIAGRRALRPRLAQSTSVDAVSLGRPAIRGGLASRGNPVGRHNAQTESRFTASEVPFDSTLSE